jgi:hypothetical protein
VTFGSLGKGISGATLTHYQGSLVLFGGLKSIMNENADIYVFKDGRWRVHKQTDVVEQARFETQSTIKIVTQPKQNKIHLFDGYLKKKQ